MNTGGEAADQMVREALQFAEAAVKLMALGFKNGLSLALAYAKENPKVRGKTSLDRLLRENRELRLIPIRSRDLKEFEKHAKQYGVLFAVIKDKDSGEKLDILFKAEDVAKLNRIYERMGYAVPGRGGQERKKAETRRPQENVLPTRGERHTELDSRPSVRAVIRRLRKEAEAIRQAGTQLREELETGKER